MTLDLFKRLGLFIQEDFLDSEFCAKYLAQISLATATPALVLPKSVDSIQTAQLFEDYRKTEQLQVSAQTESFIKGRLLAIKPILEDYFHLPMTSLQKLLFYRYTKGSFFSVHQDCSSEPDAPEFLKQRRVSVILFLNNQSPEPLKETYCGGELVFYGLINAQHWQSYGLKFESQRGMLLAFPSHVWHEVKPVIYGERHTIVSWFF